MSPLLAFLSLLAELGLGYPDRLFRAIGHPVTWLGRLIAFADRRLNRATDSDLQRRTAGVVALVLLVAVPAAASLMLETVLSGLPFGLLLSALAASPLLAQRSLGQHVQAVADALETGGLAEGRKAVSMIVGRDPERLDEAGVCRAAIESLAENTSDGIVAPVMWGALLGLPGLAAYKAINTLDSMIGHRTPRHEAFGWAAARIDDLANLVPARLTALLFALASGRPRRALACVIGDARKHRSPNAGWPESAMAGALGVRLSGPRIYAGRVADEPWLNARGRDPEAADIARALAVYVRATGVLVALLAALLYGLSVQ